MSELSFASNLDMSIPTTPIATAKSRRISILPIDHADLSSPTTALKQLQVLELENVGLFEELEHTEAQKRALQSELEALRSQLSSSSSSSVMIPSSSTSSSISDLEAEASTKRHAAEIKAAKRLLHRLAAHISTHDPTSSFSSASEDEEACFNLDQSLLQDPERSIVHTRLTQLTTPNGKRKVDREFASDLLDDIASIGSVWEEYARKASFSSVEQSVALQSALEKNSVLEARVRELESQLQKVGSIEEKEQLITQFRRAISEAKERESQLKGEMDESRAVLVKVQKKLEETEAKLDQVSAEQELIISAAAKKSAALIDALQQELEEVRAAGSEGGHADKDQGLERVVELESQLKSTSEELEDLKAGYESATAQVSALQAKIDGNVADAAQGRGIERVTELEEKLRTTAEELKQVQEESSSRITALETELEERKNKSSDLHVILNELSEKKNRLHAIQLHNAQIASLQRVLLLQERIVALLERSPDAASEKWMAYAQEFTISLSQLSQLKPSNNPKSEVSTMTTAPALVEASTLTDAAMQLDDSPSPVAKPDVNEDLVHSLKSQVEELEARVLRRNEQIGSLQRQLNNVENDLARTRTNQMLAEETVVDLDAERAEHLSLIKALEAQVAVKQGGDEKVAESQARIAALTAELEQVKALEKEKLSLEEMVDALQQQLASAASAKKEEEEQAEASVQTTEDLDKVHELELALSTAQDNITSLNDQLSKLTTCHSSLETSKSALETRISTLETDLSERTSLSATQEEELTLLRSQLGKSEELLSRLQLELDSLRLSLAEHRESASEDADRLDQLQTQLTALRTERDALSMASALDRSALEESRAVTADLESKLAQLQSDALTTASNLTAERQAKTSVESQLQQLASKHTALEHVLDQRDAAINARNTEYWNLKEELAELQELAERSHSSSASPDAETLAALQNELQSTRSSRDALEERVNTQETMLLKLKSDLSAARCTEELLNEQYALSQRRVSQLEEWATAHQKEEKEEDGMLRERLEKAEAEVVNLEERIVELQEELERKAEEIEEADSKILDALKESKKYATRYVKLSGRYEDLRVEVGKAEEKVKRVEEEVVRLRGANDGGDGGRGGGGMVRSGSGNGLVGRKRAKPDSDQVENETSGLVDSSITPDRNTAVRAIYAPCSSAQHPTRTPLGSSSFTPIRRSTHHLHKSSFDKTRSHPSIVLGNGTPSTTITTTPQEQEKGMSRSTSNPSELIAARLVSSPVKTQLLGDKTNLLSSSIGLGSGTSRLSSKPAQLSTTLKNKPSNFLSKQQGKVDRERENCSTPTTTATTSAIGGGNARGAADFLARMKAQRSASRT